MQITHKAMIHNYLSAATHNHDSEPDPQELLAQMVGTKGMTCGPACQLRPSLADVGPESSAAQE
jgi:hypothetical protein